MLIHSKKRVKYLLETLEPEESILFQLEFFDTMLQQKLLWICFEDTAARSWKNNLKRSIQQKK
jgi:hypothetical protein